MKIRTVFQPGEELEVSDEEAEVLSLQGLLHIPPAPPPTPAPTAGPPVQIAAAKPEPPATATAQADQTPPTQKG